MNYGLTWWGKKWLNALNNIDFENRLPRGKSYANSGKVISIELKNNQIFAKVKGTHIYNVKLKLQPFSKKEKELLIQNLIQDSYLLSKLINRILPEEILDIAKKHKIKIFPEKWNEIKMQCSCPDWAIPCKHIAAVMYILSKEIDQNPFTFFELRNFYIFDELKKYNIEIKSLHKETIPNIKDFILDLDNPIKKPEISYQLPDFSKLSDMKEVILSLYGKETLFFHKNFNEIIYKIYNYNKRYIKNLRFYNAKNNHINQEDRYADFEILYDINSLNEELILKLIYIKSKKEKIVSSTFEHLEKLFLTTEIKHLQNYSQSFIALYRIFEFVIKLIENNAYIPFLMECKNGYKILWQPALFNKDIRDIYEKLKTFLPEKPIVYLTNKKEKYYVKDELFFITSYILNHLIKQFSINYYFLDFTSPHSIKIYQLFFKNETINFNDFETKQYPNSIQLWLNRFYLQKDFEIFFLIKENSNGLFYIDIGIRKQNNQILYLNELDNAELLFKVYKYLNLLETFFPDINIYIKSKGNKTLFYSLENLSKLLFEIIPKLEQIGIEVLLPKLLKELIQPKPTIRIKSIHLTKYMSKDDLKNFDWVIAIGNEFIEIEEFKKLLQQNQEFIKFKEKYIYLSKNDINKLKNFIDNPPSINVSEIIHSIFTETYNGSPICINKSTKKQIEEFKKISLISLPSSIRGKLREYQLYGYSWMYKNIKLGFGCILADDMGLGKTLQSIALLAKLKEENLLKKYKALVIVPTTLITNWNNEIQKFCPDLKVHIYHGQKRELKNTDYDIVLTTYGIIRSDIEKLSSIRWSIIIIDEAQNIKNPNAQQIKAIKKLKSNYRIALSGTPVENRLSEYWSIFDFVNPGYLGSLNQFIQNYARPIEIDHNKIVLEKFKLITTPFLLRRVKTDKNIINDLPEKIENKLYCNLTVEQASLYKSTVDILFSDIEKLEGINRKGIILKLLLNLKQICNHPAQFTKDKNYDYRRSGKLQLLIQILENIYENDEKVLIFTQYQEMSDILKEILEVQFNKKILQIHGSINSKKRAYIVDLFQNHKQYDTLILTLKAGGVGLNLTAANNVIHYDMWWNPAVENQATDRAYRIGQNKNVMVYKLITKHTLEEKIKEIIDQKKELAEITIEKGEKWIGELSNEELRSIVELTGN